MENYYKGQKADVVVIDMPLLDTRRGKDLMGTFIADLVLQVLSFVAENERKNIRQRQQKGIAAAKARGVRFGRVPKPLPENFHECYQDWRMSKITCIEAAKRCEMPESTFRYRSEVYKNSKLSQAERAICIFLFCGIHLGFGGFDCLHGN